MWDKLEQVEQRYIELEKEMAEPEVIADHERLAKLARDHSELEEIVIPYREALIVRNNLEQSREELKGESDEELREMLKLDINDLEPRLAEMEENLKRLITPKDPNDRKDCIIEVRAGAGGDEAALFAGELMEMYITFAKGQRWEVNIVDLQETGLKGVKEATVEVKGRDAYGWLKFESGVHRVQRVPATESGGRIHTSTATVAVLPEVEDVDVEVNESDLKIDTYRASGAGGQHVNKTSSAIRMTHLPTGVVVTCQDQRSQLQNKEKALKVLKAKLYQMEEERKARASAENRKSQIGTGDRSEKIRTYNFPDGRITDHRIGKKVHNLEGFFRGEITEMLEALRTHEEGERLAQL
ncbi:MAG: peptide chain release factor 1 [bacterium]